MSIYCRNCQDREIIYRGRIGNTVFYQCGRCPKLIIKRAKKPCKPVAGDLDELDALLTKPLVITEKLTEVSLEDELEEEE